jgi:hypothetical protein
MPVIHLRAGAALRTLCGTTPGNPYHALLNVKRVTCPECLGLAERAKAQRAGKEEKSRKRRRKPGRRSSRDGAARAADALGGSDP